MRTTNQIDIQLKIVTAIKTNDQLVLKQLYIDNYKKVEIFIVRNSGSVEEAKDFYQEAFIAMYQNVKQDKFVPKNETALQGYLYQIAKNKWIDFLRSSEFKNKVAFLENVQQEPFSQDAFEKINPEIETNLKLTMNAFAKLGIECKKILMSFYFEKKSMKEISVEQNLAEASARNKKYRCIQKLKELAFSPNL